MPKITYGGQEFTVPDGLTLEEQYSLVAGSDDKAQGGATAPSFSNPMPTNQPVDYAAAKVDPEQLKNDPKWMAASATLYKQHHGVDFDGTPDELASYGLNQISYFNYNTMGMAVNALALKNAKQEEKESFLYLMDTFDNMGYSWAGAMRFIGAAATDPLTYVGLGTLGLGTVAGSVGQTMSKAAIRAAIQASIEAGIQSGAQAMIKQEALINADRQTEVDYGEVAKETLFGAGAGAVLGGVAGALGAKFLKDRHGLPISTTTPPPPAPTNGPISSAPKFKIDEFSVGVGSKLENASRQERILAAMQGPMPTLPTGITESEQVALLELHNAAHSLGETVDFEKELQAIREHNKLPEREFQVGDTAFKLDDNKPRDVDFEGLKVTEDEKAALEAIKAEADGAVPEDAGTFVDNRPKAEAMHKKYHPNFLPSHWGVNWHSVSNDATDAYAPVWFDKLNKTISDMANALGMEAPKVWHGDAKSSGMGGEAHSHGHIVINRSLTEMQALSTGLHELGHQVEYTLYNKADQATKDALKAAFNDYVAKYGEGKTYREHRPLTGARGSASLQASVMSVKSGDEFHNYVANDFSEWFAEQVQRALTTKLEPTNIVEKFFAQVAEYWRKIYAEVTGKVPLSDDIAKFVENNWHGDLIQNAVGKKFDPAKSLADLRAGVKAPSDDLLKGINFNLPNPVDRIMKVIDDISPDSLAPFERHPRGEMAGDGMTVSDILVSMDKRKMVDYVKELVAKATTPEQSLRMQSAFRVATNQLEARAFNLHVKYGLLTDPDDKAAAFKELARVEKIRDNIKTGDTYLSSMGASAQSQRVGSINTGKFRGVSEKSILEEHYGNADLIIQQAEAGDAVAKQQVEFAKQEYYNIVSEYYKRAEMHDDVKALQKRIDELTNSYFAGNSSKFTEIKDLMKEMRDLKLRIADAESKEFGLFGKTKDFGKRLINDINQAIISNVFGISTLTVNTIPSMIKTVLTPAITWIAKGPADEAALKEMLTFYHTMYNNIGISWQMAKAAFELERSLMMTKEFGNRFVESAQGTGILDNRMGRAMRLFPRLLTATDEFFQSLNYRGYVMGEAHYAALRDANKAGLTGQAKEAYITKTMQEAANHMFTSVQDRAKVLEWTYEVGRERGLKGDKLDAWVEKQLKERGHLMKEVGSDAGARYVEDLLFKRKFSGEGLMSDAAKKYENLTNNHPILRTVGQLFFRTPVRVFEEGLRMVPGIQILAPHFMADLTGMNGQAAYAKAMGQAMVGFSITQWVMTQYAAGNLSGGGPSDYKQRRDLEAAGFEAYTLKIGDKKVNFRNYDPFATPIKIIVNMMENASELEMRRAQGDFAKQGSDKELMAQFGVAVMAVMRAIKDANLWDGINQIATASDKASDPEHKGLDDFMVHFLGQKLSYAIPSLVSKGIQTQEPELTNPATLWQYLEAKVNPSSTSVAHQYDALGNVRKQSDPWGKLFGLQISDETQRKAGRSDREIEVLRELAKLSVANSTNFVMPTKDRLLMPGVEDLRSAMTKDGSSTLYDKVNQFLKESPLTDELHEALVGRDDMPVAAKLEMARKIISTRRKDAFTKLWADETGLQEDFVKAKLFDAEGKAGFRDTKALPYLND